MSVEDKVIAAEQAAEILNHNVLKAAFAAVEAKAIRDARNVKWFLPGADRRRRIALERANIVSEIRAELQSVITTGRLAAKPPPGVA